MTGLLIPAVRVALVTFALCGFAFPLAVTGVGQFLLPFQANGSLGRTPNGTIIGSQLIGQQWTGDAWFHGRPSATTDTDPSDPSRTISAPYKAAPDGRASWTPPETIRILIWESAN